MTVYEYIPGKTSLAGKRVIALGFFDGVHVGHRALFEEGRRLADKLSIPFAALTFFSETKALKPEGARLYTTEEKISLLSECSIDELILIGFDDIRTLTAEQFACELLLGECGCRYAVSGEDFRFGRGACGDFTLLKRLMTEAGADAHAVGDVTVSGEKVSTTRIKRAILNTDMEGAALMLARPYFISATVERGRGVGRTLGFPTVNLPLGEKELVLPHGVYKSTVEIDGTAYPALTNVGVCPTFQKRASHAEAYIIGYNGDLYGRNLRVNLISYLREEKKFSGEDELIKQIEKDIEKIKGSF